MTLLNPVRRVIQKAALRLFPVWEFLGLHVVPDHFYYPVPSSRDLDDALFDRQSACVGLDWNPAVQQTYLTAVFPKYATEREFPANPGLSQVDAAILHAMVRHHRPRQVIEVGSGASTAFMAAAGALNGQDGAPMSLTVIDPYPGEAVRSGKLGPDVGLRQVKAQAVGPEEFSSCDLLFVDSSHVAAIGSDVNHMVLEVLPRLKPGCLVHFHDIVLPREYWKEWVRAQRLFWSEQYLLHAFLLFNDRFEVLWASQKAQIERPAELSAVFPYFKSDVHRLSSFWIRRRP